MTIITKKIVKQGTFLYDDVKSVNIQIIETNFKPGSGDYEDPEEIQKDKWGKFYEILYGSTINNNEYPAGGGYFDSLENAIKHADKSVKNLKWRK
ncbi:MAG: hypothetical protein WC595_06070 [Candidatus Nanoarchaeia archaeon]